MIDINIFINSVTLRTQNIKVSGLPQNSLIAQDLITPVPQAKILKCLNFVYFGSLWGKK